MAKSPSVQAMPAAVGREPNTALSNVNVKPQEPHAEKRECPLLPNPSTESTSLPGPMTKAEPAGVTVTPGKEKAPSGKSVIDTNLKDEKLIALNGLSLKLS